MNYAYTASETQHFNWVWSSAAYQEWPHKMQWIRSFQPNSVRSDDAEKKLSTRFLVTLLLVSLYPVKHLHRLLSDTCSFLSNCRQLNVPASPQNEQYGQFSFESCFFTSRRLAQKTPCISLNAAWALTDRHT